MRTALLCLLIFAAPAFAATDKAQLQRCLELEAKLRRVSFQPLASGRSLAELQKAAAQIDPADPKWREQLAPLYHRLEGKYLTEGGRAEMDAQFLKIVEQWKTTRGYPPGLDPKSWQPDKIHTVADFFAQFPPDNPDRGAVLRTYLNILLGDEGNIADGDPDPKLRERFHQRLSELLILRIVSTHYYREAPDGMKFP